MTLTSDELDAALKGIVGSPGTRRIDQALGEPAGAVKGVLAELIIQARVDAGLVALPQGAVAIIVGSEDTIRSVVRKWKVTEQLLRVGIGPGNCRAGNWRVGIHVLVGFHGAERIEEQQRHTYAVHTHAAGAEIAAALRW